MKQFLAAVLFLAAASCVQTETIAPDGTRTKTRRPDAETVAVVARAIIIAK